MIARVDGAGALERPEIADRFDDDDRRRIAPLVAADGAGVARVDIAADRAGDDSLLRDPHRLGEGLKQRLPLANEMERRPARRARPEARQTREQLHETLDFRSGDGRGHQNGSFMPGGSGSPAVSACIFSCSRAVGLALGVGEGGDDEVFQDLLVGRRHQRRVDAHGLQFAFGGHRDS